VGHDESRPRVPPGQVALRRTRVRLPRFAQGRFLVRSRELDLGHGAWDETLTLFRQLLGALRSADRCLAAADPDGARRLLWHEKVWRRRDRQCLARLAEVCLLVEPVGAVERLRSRLALASYLDSLEGRFPVAQLFLPGETWDQERLASLAERARAWLNGS
jgi:hypothetical protein